MMNFLTQQQETQEMIVSILAGSDDTPSCAIVKEVLMV